MRPRSALAPLLTLALPVLVAIQPSPAEVADALRTLRAALAAEAAFDTTAVSHYTDDAEIRLLVHGAGSGQVQGVILTGAEYKRAINGAMPIARRRGDRNTYTGFSTETRADTVRVTATRHNSLRQYDSPIVFQLVARGGRWRIVGVVAQVVP
jgi:hypothetical protein